jgi:hypothetical protein
MVVEVICESCFSFCKSLESGTFEANSRLPRREDKAFSKGGLCSMHIPCLVEVTVNDGVAGVNHCVKLSRA